MHPLVITFTSFGFILHLSPPSSYPHVDVIADVPAAGKKKSKAKKEDPVQREVAMLRAKLVGEDWMEAVTKPVKETISAGKALAGLGQRLGSWVGRLVGTSS